MLQGPCGLCERCMLAAFQQQHVHCLLRQDCVDLGCTQRPVQSDLLWPPQQCQLRCIQLPGTPPDYACCARLHKPAHLLGFVHIAKCPVSWAVGKQIAISMHLSCLTASVKVRSSSQRAIVCSHLADSSNDTDGDSSISSNDKLNCEVRRGNMLPSLCWLVFIYSLH